MVWQIFEYTDIRAVLQFALIARISCLQNIWLVAAVSITAIVLQSQNLLCPESFSFAFGNSWLQIIKATSVTISTYFLIEFYYVIRKDIAYTDNIMSTNG